MIEELNLDSPYKIFKDNEQGFYFFITKLKVKYIFYLTDASSRFENFHLSNNIFEFGFEPEKTNKIPKTTDKKIRLTLIVFLKAFFIDKNNVLMFVADVSEFKQHARNRLFQIWKDLYDTQNEFEASYNNLNPIFNLLTGNLGYHTAHHHKMGVHWSKLPDLHATIADKIPQELYRKSRITRRFLES